MTGIRVSQETRDKLLILRGVMLKKTIEEVIISLMISRQYTAEFFKRVREGHFMKVE